jgi:hypothetical protein
MVQAVTTLTHFSLGPNQTSRHPIRYRPGELDRPRRQLLVDPPAQALTRRLLDLPELAQPIPDVPIQDARDG